MDYHKNLDINNLKKHMALYIRNGYHRPLGWAD